MGGHIWEAHFPNVDVDFILDMGCHAVHNAGTEPFDNRCALSESSLFGQVSIKDVKQHLAAAGVETRLL